MKKNTKKEKKKKDPFLKKKIEKKKRSMDMYLIKKVNMGAADTIKQNLGRHNLIYDRDRCFFRIHLNSNRLFKGENYNGRKEKD